MKKIDYIKKIVCLALSVLLVASIFCGCSKEEDKPDNKKEKEITFKEQFEMYADADWCNIYSETDIEFDTNPYDVPDMSVGKAWDAIRYAARELGFPDTLVEKIKQTTEIDFYDAYMSDDGSVTVRWIYNPKTGYVVTFRKNK